MEALFSMFLVLWVTLLAPALLTILRWWLERKR